MNGTKILMYTIISVLSWYILQWCKTKIVSDNDELNATSSENLETVKETREREDLELEKKESVNLEINSFYKNDDVMCSPTIKKYENLIEIVNNYIQRYISLFLIISNLRDYEINDLSEIITSEMEISISGEDLAYLQEFSKRLKGSAYLRNFSKLDEIMSKVARFKERSYFEKSMNTWKNFFYSLIVTLLSKPIFNHFMPFIIIVVTTYAIYLFFFKKAFYIYLGIIVNSMIFWDGVMLYMKKIKEADLELRVKLLRLNEVPQDCYPENLNWYHSITDYFFGSKCLDYYKSINKNPAEDVSLLECLVKTYGLYLLQIPSKIIGASIKDFTGEISNLWPLPLRIILQVPLVLIILVIGLLFLLILFGNRLRLSFFGASLEMGKAKTLSETKEKIAVTTVQVRPAIREGRKLRPWTKSKFPKRLDAPKRRRFLKAPRPIPDSATQSDSGGSDVVR